MKKIYLLLFFIQGFIISQGQLLSEPFNYTPSATLGLSVQSGVVWNVVNTGDSILVESGNLSYPGLAASTGNRITYGGAGTDYYRPFASQTAGTVYYSFLLNISSLGTLSTTGGYFAGFIDGGTSNFTARLWTRLSGTSNYNIGVNPGSVAANTAWSASLLSPGTTYLVVASMQIVTGTSNDIAKIWVNPAALGGSEPAADATGTNLTASDPTSIQRFFLRQDNTTNTPGVLVLDELRVGTTWADVTPTGALIPTITATPGISNMTSTVGVPSAEQSYNLSAANLTPLTGNISVTASAGLEISLNSGGPYTTAALPVSYSAGGISPALPVFVRVTSSAPQGAVNGTISHTGGGAAQIDLTVTGGVFQNYYNTKAPAAGGLTNIGSWSNTTNGLGPSPSNFTGAYQLFNIVNQPNASYSGVWDVSNAGNTARVIVGDGTVPLTLTVLPGADSLTSATRVDVLNNATLVIQNNRRPFLNNMATGSTVDFAQPGLSTADTIKVPALSYYHLKLTGGIKVLSSGTTTVRGNWTVDNVVNFNGSPSPFSTVNAFGHVTFKNGSSFEPVATGDGNRITLAMNGSDGLQNITGNGTDLLLFRLRRDSTSNDDDIVLQSSTNLTLGNSAGGGLQLAQGPATATTLISTGNTIKFIKGAVATTASLGKLSTTNTNISIEKANLNTSAGTLRFTTGSSLNQLTINFDPAVIKDSITIADNIIVNGNLTLTRGRVVMTSPAILELASGATITQGTDTAFVDGKLKRNTAAAAGFAFPVGKGLLFRPVTITPTTATTTVFTSEYFTGPYSTLTLSAPLTGVSNTEYWDIAKTGAATATVSLSLNGTAISGATATDQITVAHFESGTNSWVSVNGTAISPGNATTGTAVSSTLTAFSPFTFGVIPGGTTYTFNGNGNWSTPANWLGGFVPPLLLTAPNIIVINPSPGGECIVDVLNQHISPGAQFNISINAKIRLPGNLNIQ